MGIGRCEGGSGRYMLFFECVHLFWPIDLDVGDEGERVGEIEVSARWGSRGVRHCAMRDWLNFERARRGFDSSTIENTRQHDGVC